MKSYIFKVGAAITLAGRRFKILRILDDGRVQLECELDGALSSSTYDDLLRQYAEKTLAFIDNESQNSKSPKVLGRALSTFPEPVQQSAVRKKRYLDFLLATGRFISTPAALTPLIAECAQKIDDKRPPSSVTVYRWYREFVRHQRDCRALIDRHDRKGGTGSRLHPEVAEIVNAVIDDIYLSDQQNSGAAVFAEVVHRVNRRNEFQANIERLPIPSRATVYRAISSMDKYDAMAARKGKRIAEMKFRTSGMGGCATRILERVEIDHTPLDLFVIDDTTGLPQGRPTVTMAIDAYSKMPVGMHVGFSGTSIEAVFACLRHALTPKAYLKHSYPEIEHEWPCHGHIETLICDNGLEFHSKELERVAFELGMQIQFCPKRQAYYKGSVERFLQTLNFQFARMLPGHSFPKWFHREDYDPQKDAVVTFAQLMRYLHRWVVDIYAQQIHRGINSAPIRKWTEAASEMPPMLLADLSRLDISLGRTCERTIFHYGVELHNIRYNDTALLSLRRQHGESVKVEVRYYFDDISLVHVIDPITKEAIPTPAVDGTYACGLSLEQHRLICAHVRAENAGKIDFAGIVRAKAEIRDIIRELTFSKLQRKRHRGAKLAGVKQKNPDNGLLQKHAEPISSKSRVPLSSQVPSENLPDLGALVFSRLPKSLEL